MRYWNFLFGIIAAFLLVSGISVQQDDKTSGIALNIIVPALQDDFNERDRTALQARVEQMASHYGIGGSNFNPDFVMVPTVLIDDYETMGGGRRTLAKLEVILKIANAESKTTFATKAFKTSGVGDNKNEALSEAIKNLDTHNKKVENFINTAKEKIIQYYDSKCDKIINKAVSNAEMEKFKLAFSMLYGIPAEANCRQSALDKIEEIFNQYQKVKCSKLLSAAQAAHGAGNMEKAAKRLALIPSDSECSKKAKKLANKMEDERIMKYKTEAEIKKLKVEAAREIALAFAKNQPDEQVDIRFLNTR